jgi:hypothetical protein
MKIKNETKKCLNKLVKNFLKPSNELSVGLDDGSYFTVDGSAGYKMISILNMKGSKFPKMLSLNQFLNFRKKFWFG